MCISLTVAALAALDPSCYAVSDDERRRLRDDELRRDCDVKKSCVVRFEAERRRREEREEAKRRRRQQCKADEQRRPK